MMFEFEWLSSSFCDFDCIIIDSFWNSLINYITSLYFYLFFLKILIYLVRFCIAEMLVNTTMFRWIWSWNSRELFFLYTMVNDSSKTSSFLWFAYNCYHFIIEISWKEDKMKRRKNMFLIIDCFISISILTAITLALESIMIVAGKRERDLFRNLFVFQFERLNKDSNSISNFFHFNSNTILWLFFFSMFQLY